jgi:hypothetical protein
MLEDRPQDRYLDQDDKDRHGEQDRHLDHLPWWGLWW